MDSKIPTHTSPGKRRHSVLSYIGGDQVLLHGGALNVSPFGPADDTWIYDLSDNAWTEKTHEGILTSAGHCLAYLGEDRVLYYHSAFPWVYDLSDNTWTEQAPLTSPTNRDDFATARIRENQVLLFGGVDLSGLLADTWIYNHSDDSWTETTPATSPSARSLHALASIGEDKVLLFGGDDGALNGETWIYEITTVPVEIDFKPQGCPNPFNTKSKGKITVAVIGTIDFDVTNIDVSSVRLEGIAPVSWSFEDVADAFNGEKDDCSDCVSGEPVEGFTDLVLQFDASDLVDALGPVSDQQCIAIELTGNLNDNTPIQGEERIVVVTK
ncbi:kelch motif-containing protein [bacterium]|nr:kelch motif-containing protein [bacterium]